MSLCIVGCSENSSLTTADKTNHTIKELMNTTSEPQTEQPYSEVTNGIRVSVLPNHLEDKSDPQSGIFAFCYTVLIENLSDSVVQLLERHWVIVSGQRQIADVIGPGVIGKQPVLEPGESYEYTSGAVIHDSIGAMYGSYSFKTESGRVIEVTIPRFDLLYPLVLH